MAIIQSIRKFFKLDKRVISIDSEIVDSIGLYINEPGIIPQEEFGDCLLPHNSSITIKHDIVPIHPSHIDTIHLSHDSPFIHF